MKEKSFISRLNYNRIQNRRARKVLKLVEQDSGKLSPGMRRLCDEYAHGVLGGREYSPWLQVYAAVSGQFKEGWIPDNYYCLEVMPKQKGRYHSLSDFGTLSNSLFQVQNQQNIATAVNGLFLGPDMQVMSQETLAERLFQSGDRVVFKADDSYQGKGIHIFHQDRFNMADLTRLGDGLVERFIEQHPLFDEFAPNSVATLRITTVVKDDGTVEARAAYLRLGVGEDTHVKTNSAIKVPIDLRDGRFADVGYMANWRLTEKHPTSGKAIAGNRVPSFQACVDYVRELHTKLPFVRVIGWDLTVDKAGKPVFIEWNGGHNGIKFSEATTGPCFKDLNWH
ncbi:sugar-transfer associated ATP-grasp domain-containing protein [Ferrimonas balearica]|uniref:sugar-transfer associated ATP-grasp domain-containing protein n=1 Tax=Ferrimonas balearica TaxID=44012 RepID=UPI001C9A1ADD|nr:sugar-transfer associated ATP-grasp domain-containing protein [Ferrimonas balearica]MBY5991709.1 hypothetical protein [Ferrimonas balearica]